MTVGPVSVLEAIGRARSLLAGAQAAGERWILGIAGAPGCGKSTLADLVLRPLREADPDAVALVGMDGFHLAHSSLARLGLTGVKGAPQTFDAAGYAALLRRLRVLGDHPVWAPEYRRELHDPVAGAIEVGPEVRLVVTEGNYLLLPDGPWAQVHAELAEVWWVDIDDEVRLERLVARHVQFGRTPEAARAHALGSDQPNADLVNRYAHRADVVVGPW